MPYDIDVLITCYTADNHATESDGKWVENVRTFLQMMMTRVLREKPNVLMASELDDMTSIDLKQVALIVPVISPACPNAIMVPQSNIAIISNNFLDKCFTMILVLVND